MLTSLAGAVDFLVSWTPKRLGEGQSTILSTGQAAHCQNNSCVSRDQSLEWNCEIQIKMSLKNLARAKKGPTVRNIRVVSNDFQLHVKGCIRIVRFPVSDNPESICKYHFAVTGPHETNELFAQWPLVCVFEFIFN